MKKIGLVLILVMIIALVYAAIGSMAEDELDLTGAVVAVIIGEGYNEVETSSILEYLENRNVEVILAGVEITTVTPYDRLRVTREVEVLVKDINPNEIDGLVFPGGYAADNLATNEDVTNLVRKVDELGKPCAAIRNAPVVFAEAKIVEGRNVTSDYWQQNPLNRAKANWTSERVVVDDNLITSRGARRWIQDLRYFNAEIGLLLNKILINRDR